MGITTKVGDRGRTSLYFGGRVNKDDIRVDAYGTLDELCSCLGFSRSMLKDNRIKNVIESIQRDLFAAGAEIATKPHFLGKLKKRIDDSYVRRLEAVIEELEGKRKFEESCFYLPGEDPVSSSLDIARTVTRRAERKIVSLKRRNILKNPYILIYLNRLSDLLYLMARTYEKKHKKLT
jgi:cob(I)alamin adenosyltransferase